MCKIIVAFPADNFLVARNEASVRAFAISNQFEQIKRDKRHRPKVPIISLVIQQIARIHRHVNCSVSVNSHGKIRGVAQINPSSRFTSPSSTAKVSSTASGVDMSTPAACNAGIGYSLPPARRKAR